MDKKSVSVSWSIEGNEDCKTTVTIDQIDVPNHLHRLVIGKTLDGDRFGNGFELYLEKDGLEKLKKALDGYLAL